MITTPEEYAKYLWGIEATDEEGHPINPYNNKPLLSVILPSDEKTFEVDLDARTISVPTFLSVAKDHRAETIYFLVDRYYDYKDLSEVSCMIEFINAAGEGGYYPVPFVDISTYIADEKMLIPWCIEGDVTKENGPVQFAIRFYQLDDANEKFIYNLRTQIAVGQVLTGMDESELDANIDTDLMANLLLQINNKLETTESTIYWTDLPKPTSYSPNLPDQDLTSDVEDYLSGLGD